MGIVISALAIFILFVSLFFDKMIGVENIQTVQLVFFLRYLIKD
jgi:hypothetical protein